MNTRIFCATCGEMVKGDHDLQHRLDPTYLSGVEWARSLKPGMKFEGAMPEAKVRYAGLVQRHTFVSGAFRTLARIQIYVDQANVITQVIPVGGKA